MVFIFITENLKDCMTKINYIRTSNPSITPELNYYDTIAKAEFIETCLK